ncbi:hypothetical protein MSM1_17210 [Mycobacterium sp. SM1]|uniref:hypothetical protein n=1 Tax=Mycobacterium sp. SM1 TaxID=2816243 RepID=UPI001BCA87F1|nr:hypothetical protein [Mycobacterium sp. SM1]MBS4730006.1 hypothetical protein [Mycobacterium sp. SM1]
MYFERVSAKASSSGFSRRALPGGSGAWLIGDTRAGALPAATVGAASCGAPLGPLLGV